MRGARRAELGLDAEAQPDPDRESQCGASAGAPIIQSVERRHAIGLASRQQSLWQHEAKTEYIPIRERRAGAPRRPRESDQPWRAPRSSAVASDVAQGQARERR